MTTPFPPVIPITLDYYRALEQDRRHVDDDRWPRPSLHRTMFRGDTWQLPCYVVNDQTQGPIDVTGWTFWLTAKYALPNPDAQAAFQQDNIPGGYGGIMIVSATAGEVLATVQPLTTRSYPDGDVHVDYDVQGQDTSGIVITIERGRLTIKPDVTRAITS